ncbi:hypothetical protein Kpho01_21920 [Kitasatospora phosalacinea]|uniref:Uncharacterized protein n=1 Tax=Kitasatospora phosalacinea TaxID=2065 RepID=A0A9W6PG05_9ACTN|nr:hypothetical protein Kpho01_21920 [Kitasatospora phosalacinea]
MPAEAAPSITSPIAGAESGLPQLAQVAAGSAEAAPQDGQMGMVGPPGVLRAMRARLSHRG